MALPYASGEQVVSYTYDAWGRQIASTGDGSLAAKNPFRYRGYYYDGESGWYYLGNRYYDPEVGRFLNPDSEIAGVGGDISGYNLYSYCHDNPVNMDDPDGNWPKWAKKVVAAVAVVATVAAVAAITVATAGAGTVAACVAIGAAKGAVIGFVAGAAVGAAVGAVSHRSRTKSWSGAGTAALNSAAGGAYYGAHMGAAIGGATAKTYNLSGSQSSKATSSINQKPGSLHTNGIGSPNNNINPGGSFTKLDNSGNLYSYTQFDDLGRQTMRMDFQGRPHSGVLPHIHLYVYPSQGGRVDYIFDLNWHLIN